MFSSRSTLSIQTEELAVSQACNQTCELFKVLYDMLAQLLRIFKKESRI